MENIIFSFPFVSDEGDLGRPRALILFQIPSLDSATSFLRAPGTCPSPLTQEGHKCHFPSAPTQRQGPSKSLGVIESQGIPPGQHIHSTAKESKSLSSPHPQVSIFFHKNRKFNYFQSFGKKITSALPFISLTDSF